MSDNTEIFREDLFTTDEEGRVRLIAGYSKDSDNYTFPKYLADPVSFSDDIEEKLLSPTGVLHSFTIVRRSMPMGEEMAITTGVIKKTGDGRDVISYKFIPVREQ
jgi:uncharacterized OB-fold protein